MKKQYLILVLALFCWACKGNDPTPGVTPTQDSTVVPPTPDPDGTIYYTTAKTNNREFYFLYKMVDGKAVKLGKARNPKDLDDKYIL